MFNVGDKLYCHTAVKMIGTNDFTTTSGKFYYIIHIDKNKFAILDDACDSHWFSLIKNQEIGNSKYTRWFTTIKKLRRKKIKKINECTKNT